MQKWVLTVVAAGLVVGAATARAENAPDVQTLKGSEGEPLGVLLQCNSCAAAGGPSTKCHTGVEEGFLNGQPCGKCMIGENYGARLSYPYDLLFTGQIVDAKGEPVKDRFVKVFMANGWSLRTRTGPDGKYRLMLGATAERKSTTPLALHLGTRVDAPKENRAYYAMFLLPDGYKACPADSKPASKSPKKPKKAPKP